MTENTASAEEKFFQGNRHMAAGDAAQALDCFLEALRQNPSFAEAHANLALLLDQAGMRSEAEEHYRWAIACDPRRGEVYLNLGGLLAHQKRFDEADGAYRQALALLPDSAPAWSNLGVLQACRKQEDQAEASYRQALALDPDYRLARFNFAYVLLRQGRFEEGWHCLEARDWYGTLEDYLECPRWQGESLAGKSLLIGVEAGHGDMIQLCRYAALLKAQGAAFITCLCHPALKRLFLSLEGVDEVIALDEPLPASGWDVWTPPLSIPFHCKTRLDSIPAALPYLHAEPGKIEAWSTRLAREDPGACLRVALVWKGSPRFESDADRSLPGLQVLAPLGSVEGVRFFSLQKGDGEREAQCPPAGLSVVNLGPDIADFSDTAAIMANLHLVISVDTAVAHLAGAMGKTCWVLLPDYKTDWRWLKDRPDTPWYPGVMRLFRQPRMGDWESVIDQVAMALGAFAKTSASGTR